MQAHVLVAKAAVLGDLEVLLLRCRTETAGVTPGHLYDLQLHLERALRIGCRAAYVHPLPARHSR